MSAEVARKLFNVDEYYRMAETGILTEEDRVELIEGEIIRMSPIGSRHAGCLAKCVRLLGKALGEAFIVRPQSPIRIGRFNEPEPDIAVVPFRADYHTTHHPTPSQVLLVVEIMDTSVQFDRSIKLPLYARAGIPEVWLIDINQNSVEVHTRPEGERYRESKTLRGDDRIHSTTVASLELRISDLLP